jgi:hypothetical protein
MPFGLEGLPESHVTKEPASRRRQRFADSRLRIGPQIVGPQINEKNLPRGCQVQGRRGARRPCANNDHLEFARATI